MLWAIREGTKLLLLIRQQQFGTGKMQQLCLHFYRIALKDGDADQASCHDGQFGYKAPVGATGDKGDLIPGAKSSLFKKIRKSKDVVKKLIPGPELIFPLKTLSKGGIGTEAVPIGMK